MKDFVKEAEKTFNTHSESYKEKTKDYLKNYLQKEAGLFLSSLKGTNIIDLGAGPGRDAVYFKEKGFSVLCADISDNMLNLCKKKGLKTIKIDIINIEKLNMKFDGVWSYTTLHLMPKKEFIALLPKIKPILKAGGIFFLGLPEGEEEGWKENEEKFPGTKRWCALYKKEELEKILSRQFRIIFFSRTKAISLDKSKNKRISYYLNFICST